MSVLAHVATSMGERGATQALAYILNNNLASSELLSACSTRQASHSTPRHHIQAEKGNDGNQPDMTIHDMNDPSRLRVLIENKFWADLTNKQPVGYLKELPEDVSSALLFIVPSDRVRQIWNELKRRCVNKGFSSRTGGRGNPSEMGAGGRQDDADYGTGKTSSIRWKGLPMDKKSDATSSSFDDW